MFSWRRTVMCSCAEQTEHNDTGGMWRPGCCSKLRLQYAIPVQRERTFAPLIMHAAASCRFWNLWAPQDVAFCPVTERWRIVLFFFSLMVSQNKTVRLHKLWLRTQETGLSFISYHASRTTPPWILPGKERSQNHNLSPLRGGNCHGDSVSSTTFTSMFSVYMGMLTSANTCAHPLYPIVNPLEILAFSLITVDPSLPPSLLQHHPLPGG